MPTRILAAGHRRRSRYEVPPGRKVDIYVSASEPVNIYAVDEDGLESVRAGRRIAPSDGLKFSGYDEFSKEIRLPFAEGTDWYLVIQNPTDDDVAIHWSVTLS